MTTIMATELAQNLDHAAQESNFSGVIRVDSPGITTFEKAYGQADRTQNIPNTSDTKFGIASITKGFTAATIGALIDDCVLTLDTKIRPILKADLPLIDDAVTIGQLLNHTSGIGDYLDESSEEITDYVLPVPVHTLDEPENYLKALDGKAQVSAPGTEFAYNNSGYCVLALVAERAAHKSFYDLVQDKVFTKAGMRNTSFPRSDEPQAHQAVNYLDDETNRTNILHLPVRGNGDGGVVTTAEDLTKFWHALTTGKIVKPETLITLIEPITVVEDEDMRYGHGFYRGLNNDLIILEGYDAGVSARTWHDPHTNLTASIISNWTNGLWPVLEAVDFEAEQE